MRVHDRLHQLEYDMNCVELSLGTWSLHLTFLTFLFELIFKSPQSRLNFNFLLLMPKLLRNKFLKILKNLLHHDQSFHDSFGLLLHKIKNKFKLVINSIQFPTSQFKIDNPIGNNSIKTSFLPNFNSKILVIPQLIAKFLIKRQHPNIIHLLKIMQLVKYPMEHRSTHQFIIFDQYLIENTQQMVLNLCVFELQQIGQIYFLELELHWRFYYCFAIHVLIVLFLLMILYLIHISHFAFTYLKVWVVYKKWLAIRTSVAPSKIPRAPSLEPGRCWTCPPFWPSSARCPTL